MCSPSLSPHRTASVSRRSWCSCWTPSPSVCSFSLLLCYYDVHSIVLVCADEQLWRQWRCWRQKMPQWPHTHTYVPVLRSLFFCIRPGPCFVLSAACSFFFFSFAALFLSFKITGTPLILFESILSLFCCPFGVFAPIFSVVNSFNEFRHPTNQLQDWTIKKEQRQDFVRALAQAENTQMNSRLFFSLLLLLPSSSTSSSLLPLFHFFCSVIYSSIPSILPNPIQYKQTKQCCLRC